MQPETALSQYFSFDSFRPGQLQALEHVLAGRHTLVVMPTGSGKSLIYQLAAMLRPGTTLVISPLVALMKDQVDSLARRGLPATFINSSLGPAEHARRLAALAAGAYRMVLVAPERLRSRAFLDALAQVRVDLLTVDEAHCVSQWGHDFRPDYLHLAEARRAFGQPVTLALTATATRAVQADIVRLLGLPGAEAVVTGFNRPNVRLEVQPAATGRSKLAHARAALAQAQGAAIIYASTRREAEALAAELRDQAGVPARHYHGTLDAATRTAVQDAFLSGSLPVVVATNAFGMGIDRPDVRLVLHYNLPGSLEAYYQEAGRAGRDGLPARALLLYAPQDARVHERLIESDAPRLPDVRALHAYATQAGSFTLADVERDLGLDPVRARVGLQQLEAAGALRRAPGDAGSIRVQAAALTPAALEDVTEQVAGMRAHKLDQLRLMVGYAQSGACRRRLILDHFGDSGLAEAGPASEVGGPECCDNCHSRAQPSLAAAQPAETQAERAALIVLDAVARLRWPLGKRRLARLLQGKPDDKGPRLQSPYAGRFAALRLREIEDLVEQLVEARYLRHAGTERPVLALTEQGQAALEVKAAISVRLRPVTATQTERAQQQRQAGGTVAHTGRLFAQGRSPEQIAAERGLAPGTIYGHLAELIAQGQVPVEQVVPAGLLAQVRAAIAEVGSAARLAPIRERLPAKPDVDWGLIRCVASDWMRQHRPPGPAPTEPAAPTPARPPQGQPAAQPSPTAAPLEALAHPSAAARGLAVVLLGQPGASAHVEPLVSVLAGDPAPRVRAQAAQALGRIGDARARAALEQAAADPGQPSDVRAAARAALSQLRGAP